METLFLLNEDKRNTIIVSATLLESRLWNRQLSSAKLFYIIAVKCSIIFFVNFLNKLKCKQTFQVTKSFASET